MKQSILNKRLSTASVAAALCTLAFAACSPRENAAVTTTGTPGATTTTDATAAGTAASPTAVVTQTGKTAGEVAGEIKADASVGLDKAKDATAGAVQGVKQAGQAAGEKVADAVITTSVNAELAKDAQLSALRIDVDTADGKVALKGTAPTEAARAHATALATSVKGVVSVDNQLTVSTAK